MQKKIHPDDIIIENSNIKFKDDLIDIESIKINFKNLSKEEFQAKYNLSCRATDKLIKELNLSKPKISQANKLLAAIDPIKFEKDYRSLSKAALIQKYSSSESILKSVANKLNIKLSKDEILNRVQLTNIEKYGVSWYASTADWNKATKKTKLERYGDENYNNADKARQTNLNRYGETNPNKTSIIKEKIKRINLEKYGTEDYFASDDFKAKAAETKLNKYGTASFTNRLKAEKTCLEKYGTKNPNQCDEVKNKRAKTNLTKYGCKNVFGNNEIKEKIKNSIEAKYGVPYAYMTANCRNAAGSADSSANINFKNLLILNNIAFEREYSLENRSYDFKVNNYLIEINPTATHNSTWGWRGNKNAGLSKTYHKDKTQLAINNGFKCICVWDWDDIDKIIKLVLPRNTCYARQCEIKSVGLDEEIGFLNSYHLQGYIKSDIRLGLFFNGQLVSLMTFGKPRYNKNFQYELLRYCSSINIIGGAEKLFKYFCHNYSPESIISYCDLSKFSGEVYNKLGFSLKSTNIKPSLHWYHIQHKVHITDNLLRQRGFDQLFNTNFGKGSDNRELMLAAGFVEVYDCGQAAYIYFNTCKGEDLNA